MEVLTGIATSLFFQTTASPDDLALGVVYASKGNDRKAIQSFERYINKSQKIEEKTADLLQKSFNLILSRRWNRKNNKLAIKCNTLLAEMYIKVPDRTSAIEKYGIVEQLAPRDATITLKIGILYEDIVYRQKAIEYFNKTIALSKKYPTPENKKAAEKAIIARDENIKILKRAAETHKRQ